MQHKANPRRANPEVRGFTLLEALVALALFCLLAGLVWPTYSALKQKARRSEARAALLQAMQQQERYFTANGRYAEFSRSAPNGFTWYSGATPAASSHELQAQACDQASLEECVLISATPGTPAINAAAADPQCGVFTLNSRSERGADGDAALCWQ